MSEVDNSTTEPNRKLTLSQRQGNRSLDVYTGKSQGSSSEQGILKYRTDQTHRVFSSSDTFLLKISGYFQLPRRFAVPRRLEAQLFGLCTSRRWGRDMGSSPAVV